jgi:diguanylate cyclase (GGDEF)-like protein/PAS domain S-box-containing protein
VAWGTWFTAHLLGMVVVATLTVCAFQQGVYLFGERGRRLDFALCFGLLLAICALAFGQSAYSLLFLVYLPLLLLAYRHGLSGMVMGVIAVAGISGITAASDVGSFALAQTDSPVARLLYWQVYLASACLLAYSTAVAMVQRRQFEARLRASQAQLQSITDHIPALVARFDRQGRYVYANPRSRESFPGMDLIGKTLAEVRPDRADTLAPIVAAALRGEPQSYEARLEVQGRPTDLSVQFVPDLGSDGTVHGFYSLAFDISAQKQSARALEELARVDALTGLANRRRFEENLASAIARAARTGAPLMVLSLDLDKFKQINDTLGHAAGDEVLKEFGRRVQASVYDVDLVARLGGDEFVVLVEYSATAEAGEHLARRIIAAMVAPISLASGQQVQAATSIGIGLAQPVSTGDALLALADQARNEAKGKGRNTFAQHCA